MKKTVLIIGTSAGFGAACAPEIQRSGKQVDSRDQTASAS